LPRLRRVLPRLRGGESNRAAGSSDGADRFSLDQMDDPNEDAGCNQGRHELHDDAPVKPRLAEKPECSPTDPASDEASHHPEHHIPDDAEAVTGHDPASEPAGYAPDDDAADDAQHRVDLLK